MKSFFAKEVARGAECLRTQQSDLRDGARLLIDVASSGSSNLQQTHLVVDVDSVLEQEGEEYEGEEDPDTRITTFQQVRRSPGKYNHEYNRR